VLPALQHLVAGRLKPWLWLTLATPAFTSGGLVHTGGRRAVRAPAPRRGVGLDDGGLVLALIGLFRWFVHRPRWPATVNTA
jgi:hypothetical protein